MTNLVSTFTHCEVKKPKQNRENFSLLCPDVEDSDSQEERSCCEIIMNEIKHYCTIRVDLNEDSCPLKFYKMYQLVLPYMSRIASMVFYNIISILPASYAFIYNN